MSSKPEPRAVLTRRQAIQRVSAVFGGAVLVGQSAIVDALAGLGSAPVPSPLSATDMALLDEIAETILPETSTPGARAAGVGPFMAVMVADAYTPAQQEVFSKGLLTLNRECVEMSGHSFMSATPAERLRLLERLDREQFDQESHRRTEEPVHYFRMLKQLALLGYFTSEIGYTKAMRYRETPGRFEPCVPYSPGEKSWASHA